VKRLAVLISGFVLAGTVAGAAGAAEGDPDDLITGGNGTTVVWTYDAEEGTLVIAVAGPDGDLPECSTDEDDPDVGGLGPASLDDDELPDGCFVIDIEAEGANHGAFVSAVATGLHPSLLPDGVKKGEIMREIAKSSLGKGDTVGEDDELGDDEPGDEEPSDDEAKAERKAARDELKAERKAARDELKAERKAARDELKAERKAARDELKAHHGRGSGRGGSAPGAAGGRR
jgi:hypothetical protein